MIQTALPDKPRSTTSESDDFRFRAFQVDDLARAAMHDGLILGWDPGLFKTGAAYVWPWIRCARRVLIVAPEQLHDQIVLEGVRFGIKPRQLLTHEQFYNDKLLCQLAVDHANGTVLTEPAADFDSANPPAFWLTSYSALGLNGGDMWTPETKDNGEIVVNRNIVSKRKSHPLYREEQDRNIGLEHNGMRCVFYPSLALLCSHLFDCVVADESVRMKSNDTYCSLGVRMMEPRLRLPLTATPIKNHLDDIFWLAQWACGGHAEPTARWPYANTTEAKETFANEHMLIEQNHTREAAHAARTGRFRTVKKRTSKICNIHRLWKLLGPVVLRRAKDQTGEDIVSKTVIPIRVKPGTAQQIVYQFHLDNPPTIAKNGNAMKKIAAVVSQLQSLRQAALCPDTSNLSEVGLSMHALRGLIDAAMVNADADAALTNKAALVANKGERTPFANERQNAIAIVERMAATGKIDIGKVLAVAPSLEETLRPFVVAFDARKHSRSWTDHNPKQAAILKLIEEEISRGEQVVVMSPFQHFSACLYRRLIEANVSACLLDGNIPPKRRGQIAYQFKRKKFAVLVAGIHSMGEGNSFECASVLILPSLDWAYDKNKQAIDRVHRLVSKKPVKIYTMVTTNTIDERLESVFREKGDSSNLALDGRLFADKTDEINLGELLAEAIRNFNPRAATVPEKDIEQEWESTLRQKLRHAEERFREFHPPIAPDSEGGKVTSREVRDAVLAVEGRDADTSIASIINCIPTATIGALIGSPDRAKIDKARADFIDFCVRKAHTDWRRAWRAFEATGAIEKI